MKEIVADKNTVAFCGLYCGACRAYLKEKCPGCRDNEKATWCKIRSCCLENDLLSCADCKTFTDPNQCKMFSNFVSKIFGFVFRSNRKACICSISELGYEKYAENMAKSGRQSMRR
ncbi:MAG: DUF3795 domain-containing protein [Proteobacteria bacterium]|nr:DUF3795 domain-containing protein [Pseudomonadota bacterium]